VTIHPSEQGFWKNRVRFDAADYQASPEQMTYSYSLNEGKWVDTTETSISLSDVEPGRHTLRVKATDLAGNEGMSSRVIVVKGSRWGCASSGNGDATWVFVILTLLALRFGRRQRV
jgi:MYXO-CTERM domain-containing protein